MDADPARIARYLEEIGAEAERQGEREWGLRLPSTKRGAIGAALSVRERTLTIRAFVLRGPDRAHEEVYRRLLHKNLTTPHWRFAIDADGDVFLVCDASLAALDADALDGLLGSLCSVVDETYESVVRTGFDVPEGTEFRPPPGGG
ncbi:MAG TPA: YbjN domain-containing protein [Miltoncostaeaceae bacterium]|nr:YbjN domain-containing protein [Miltoncostaeaceae bacterium]